MIKKDIRLEAITDNLTEINSFLENIYEEADIPIPIQFKLNLAVEELFVNICNYAYGDKIGEVKIECLVNDDISVTLIDWGVPFDPLDRKDPNTHASIDERPIGGLGIYMTKKNVDKFEYEYKDNKNISTISKII